MRCVEGYFVTGTDTGVGKTVVSAAIIELLKKRHQRVGGMKPVASGCEDTPEGLRNEDALMLMEHSSVDLSYKQVNPYAFETAIAPHIAAEKAGVAISIDTIIKQYEENCWQLDAIVVEGVGGWRVPLREDIDTSHLAMALGLPVILVVGIRLGCLNHALLSAEAIVESGLPLEGWVANCVDPDVAEKERQIETLQRLIAAPCLGVVGYQLDGLSITQVACRFHLPTETD